MRINGFISATGLCSRREADQLIIEGKVTVNGILATMGQQVSESDVILVRGVPLTQKQKNVYILLNKPVGITCTTQRHIQGNIVDFVKYPERIFPIGRLDKDSEGLILLTNDGSIVNKILRSENAHEKDYIVRVNQLITSQFLHSMSQGVRIYNPVKNEYTVTKKSRVKKINDTTFQITLTQGLNRQIRRMCSQLGYRVVSLKRVRIMHLKLNNLPTGKWRHLSQDEVKELLVQIL